MMFTRTGFSGDKVIVSLITRKLLGCSAFRPHPRQVIVAEHGRHAAEVVALVQNVPIVAVVART